MVDQALLTVGHWLMLLLHLVLGIFAAVAQAMRDVMVQLHIGAPFQTIIMVLLTIGLVILAVRVFGGVFRILLATFLVLLLVRMVMH